MLYDGVEKREKGRVRIMTGLTPQNLIYTDDIISFHIWGVFNTFHLENEGHRSDVRYNKKWCSSVEENARSQSDF